MVIGQVQEFNSVKEDLATIRGAAWAVLYSKCHCRSEEASGVSGRNGSHNI